jgi:hypothetical protein
MFLPLSPNVWMSGRACASLYGSKPPVLHHVNKCTHLSHLVATTLRPKHHTARLSALEPTTHIVTVSTHPLRHRARDTLSATPHSSDDNVRSDSQNKNHVDHPEITTITPHHEYNCISPDFPPKKAPSRRHNSLSPRVEKDYHRHQPNRQHRRHHPREPTENVHHLHLHLHRLRLPQRLTVRALRQSPARNLRFPSPRSCSEVFIRRR